QHLEVLRDGRLRDVERGRKLRDPGVTLGQPREDRATGRIRKGSEHDAELVGCHSSLTGYITEWLQTSGRERGLSSPRRISPAHDLRDSSPRTRAHLPARWLPGAESGPLTAESAANSRLGHGWRETPYAGSAQGRLEHRRGPLTGSNGPWTRARICDTRRGHGQADLLHE